ncbi:hypothetical protein ACIXQ7_20540 [Bacteroides fragilis]
MNIDLSNEKAGMWHMELPAVCVLVYKCIVEKMVRLINDGQLRNIFYSFMLGERISTVSQKTGIAPNKLAYMYKRSACLVLSEWKPISEMKRDLYAMQVKCRNYESLLDFPRMFSGCDYNSSAMASREQDIPLEHVDLLATPLEELNMNSRSLHTLRKHNIDSLGNLLHFIKVNGFDSLYKILGMENSSVEHIYARLKERRASER